ncbi:hypothetical protein AMK16_12055 [Streptomyces sp. CB00455]|uniref:hypothetical protein n=1 Tax=Streptomyces sp. CB00455 TaxID=1703927 RepID=UPI0009394DE9|nr:hypothetical protein [Streptomyces sp. CB00455]OKK21090.1 hypothetical protein AMK16_12055 [Streptomyces sp. CB00455]
MTVDHAGSAPTRKRRWARWALGVPLALIHAPNALVVYALLRYPPQGSWDHQGYTGSAMLALVSLTLSVIGLLITLVPPVRRTLGTWWLAPPVVLGAIAWIRMATLE